MKLLSFYRLSQVQTSASMLIQLRNQVSALNLEITNLTQQLQLMAVQPNNPQKGALQAQLNSKTVTRNQLQSQILQMGQQQGQQQPMAGGVNSVAMTASTNTKRIKTSQIGAIIDIGISDLGEASNGFGTIG